jgi:hypothetical protein
LSNEIEWTVRIPSWLVPWWDAMLQEKGLSPQEIQKSQEDVDTECQTFRLELRTPKAEAMRWALVWLIRLGAPNIISVKTEDKEKTQTQLDDLKFLVGPMYGVSQKNFGCQTGDAPNAMVGVSEKWMAIESKSSFFKTKVFQGWENIEDIRQFGRTLSKHSSSHMAAEVKVDFSRWIDDATVNPCRGSMMVLGDAVDGYILQWLKAHQYREVPLTETNVGCLFAMWGAKGGSFEKRNTANGNSLLHNFMFWGVSESEMSSVLKAAIQKGADIELKNHSGKTPLDMAAANRLGNLMESTFWGEGGVQDWKMRMQSFFLKTTTGIGDSTGKKKQAL